WRLEKLALFACHASSQGTHVSFVLPFLEDKKRRFLRTACCPNNLSEVICSLDLDLPCDWTRGRIGHECPVESRRQAPSSGPWPNALAELAMCSGQIAL